MVAEAVETYSKVDVNKIPTRPGLKRTTSLRFGGFLSRGSLHRNRRQSLSFYSDRPVSEDTACSSSSPENSCEYSNVPRKGILKSQSSLPSIPLRTAAVDEESTVKKSVTFAVIGSLTKVRTVQPFKMYARDLWWTKEEANMNKQAQSDFSNKSIDEKELAREYLRGVHYGRKQIRQHQELRQQEQQLPQDCGTKGQVPVPQISVSTEYFERLVKGRSYGLAGLEMYMDKREDVRSITAMIVQRYCNHTASNFNDDDGKDVNEDSFHSFVRSLTAADRSWAFVVGRADSEAARRTPVNASA